MTIPWCTCGPGVATVSTSPFCFAYTCWDSGPPALTKPREAPLQESIAGVVPILTPPTAQTASPCTQGFTCSSRQTFTSENKEPWNWGYRNNYLQYRNCSKSIESFSFRRLLANSIFFLITVSSTMIYAWGFANLGVIHQSVASELRWYNVTNVCKRGFEIKPGPIRTFTVSTGCYQACNILLV